MKQYFTENIITWAADIERNMPWKDTRDPYLIWLSEVILQQTRVEQGLPYFLKFRDNYPTVTALANAPIDEVLKLWQGLGYYSRARNLHSAAKYIHIELGGKFPQNFESLRALKGVGDYTAAAIASFAYNEDCAVIDGNVYRVLARYFGIDIPIDSTEGKKLFRKLADELLPPGRSAVYNQAIMDFGAIQCKPANPLCHTCPLSSNCKAFNNDTVNLLPVKAKKLLRRERFFHYLVLRRNGNYYLSKRINKDVWESLYEFPMVEGDRLLDKKDILKLSEQTFGKELAAKLKFSGEYRQQLTHQKINGVFYTADLLTSFNTEQAGWVETDEQNLGNFAFPKIIDCYLRDNRLYLNF